IPLVSIADPAHQSQVRPLVGQVRPLRRWGDVLGVARKDVPNLAFTVGAFSVSLLDQRCLDISMAVTKLQFLYLRIVRLDGGLKLCCPCVEVVLEHLRAVELPQANHSPSCPSRRSTAEG